MSETEALTRVKELCCVNVNRIEMARGLVAVLGIPVLKGIGSNSLVVSLTACITVEPGWRKCVLFVACSYDNGEFLQICVK
jgi:hypothetical protein